MHKTSRVLRFWGIVLVAILMLAQVGMARDMTRGADSAMDSVADLEAALWGETKTGSAMERTAYLETAVFGQAETAPVLTRLGKLSDYLLPGKANALAIRLSSLEWILFKRVSSAPLSVRLDDVEKALVGNPASGAIIARLDADLKTVGIDGYKVSAQPLGEGVSVPVRLVAELDSEKVRPNQDLSYEVASDIVVDGATVIPAGAKGSAHIVSVKPAGRLGKDAQMEIDFCSVVGIDGTSIPLGAKSAVLKPGNPDHSTSLAVGAGATGLALLGPAGLAGSVLVKGHDLSFPAGTGFELFTSRPVTVNVFRP